MDSFTGPVALIDFHRCEQVNPDIGVVSSTLSRCRSLIMNYAMVLVVILVAFSIQVSRLV